MPTSRILEPMYAILDVLVQMILYLKLDKTRKACKCLAEKVIVEGESIEVKSLTVEAT